MLLFSNEHKSVLFREGKIAPESVHATTPGIPQGISRVPYPVHNHKLWEASKEAKVRAPQITYGVDYCDLNCNYCLNEYENSTGEFSLSKYGSKVEALTRLCEWISQSSEYSLGWAVGEPLSRPGLAFIERFQYALTNEAREKCYNIGLHTNGTWLNKNPFPDQLYSQFRRRSVYWTVSLLSESEESHRSIEKHFDFLMQCARNYRAKGWTRGLRMVLPVEIPLSELPDDLIQRAIEFIWEAQPDTVEPFYLVRLERPDADLRHHAFNPNVRDFLWRLYKTGFMSTLSPMYHARLIERNTLSMYDKIIQTNRPTEFQLNDLKSYVKTDSLPEIPYKDYAQRNLRQLMTGEPNEMCLSCSGMAYCTVFQRPDLHYVMGWDRESHRQYEDTLLNMMYVYGLIYLDRATKGAATEFYTGQSLSADEVELFFPANVDRFVEKEKESHPDEVVTEDAQGVYRTGRMVAMRLEGANFNLPGYSASTPYFDPIKDRIVLPLRRA